MRTFLFIFPYPMTVVARTEFWTPVAPQQAHSSSCVKFTPETLPIAATKTIRHRNNPRPERPDERPGEGAVSQEQQPAFSNLERRNDT